MLRYDPSKKEHLKYLELPKNEDSEPEDTKEEEEQTEKPFEVTEDRFYEVSSNLKSSLQQKENKPFSIFGMLGITHKDELEKEEEPQKYEEKQIKKIKNYDPLNQVKFKYDSSDTDDDAEKKKIRKKKSKKVEKKGGKYSKTGIWRANFFLEDDDERLKGE